MDILEENDNFTLSADINGPTIAAFVGVEMVAALLTNSLVLISTFCHQHPCNARHSAAGTNWKLPSTIFLTNLLIINLVIATTVMPFIIISAASGEWVFGRTVEQKLRVCHFAGYMFWYSILLLTASLAVISFDRFLFIVKAYYYKRIMTPYVAVITVIVVWVVLALLNATPFFGFGKFSFSESPGSCYPRWEGEAGYLMYFVIIFVLILIVIVVTSVWTLWFTKNFLKRVMHHDHDTSLQTTATHDNIYLQKWRKVIGIFGTLSLVYLISFILPLLYLILRVGTVVFPDQFLPVVLVLFFLITILSPLVQVIFRKDVKDFISSMLSRMSCQTEAKVNSKRTRSSDELQTNVSMML